MKIVKTTTEILAIALSLFCTLYLYGCKNDHSNKSKTETLFESISPDVSGVRFENNIKTSDSLNLVNFEYIYIGGGVGIGDYNNDG